jgi:hypothetical protein
LKVTRRALVVLELFHHHATAAHLGRGDRDDSVPDVLDADIRSKKTFESVREASSPISKRWEIVSVIQPEDFLQALSGVRAKI